MRVFCAGKLYNSHKQTNTNVVIFGVGVNAVVHIYKCWFDIFEATDWESDQLLIVTPALSTAATYNVSVQLDGTLAIPPVHTFSVLPDPVLYSFDDGTKKVHAEQVLQIRVSLGNFIYISSSSFFVVYLRAHHRTSRWRRH